LAAVRVIVEPVDRHNRLAEFPDTRNIAQGSVRAFDRARRAHPGGDGARMTVHHALFDDGSLRTLD